MGDRFYTGMPGPDAVRKLNELDASVQGAVDGAGEAIAQAEAARDDTFAARDQADGYRAIAVAAGLTATEKAAQVEASRQQVEADAQAANDDRIAADAAAEATAQDRDAVAQIVADGTQSLGQQLAVGIDEIGTARTGALQDLSQASDAALSSITTEVGKATSAATASDQSRAQSVAAAGTAIGKAEQTAADAQATAGDREATGAARDEAVTAAGTATGKAQQTAGDAEATAADRQATGAARGEAVAAAGTATSKAQATAADADATAADRQIVLTARGEAIQGATDALAAADTAEGHVEAAAAILASVQAHGNGWTPILVLAVDGERRVLRVLSWAGGVGTPPATGYLAESGVVVDPGLAINVRGARGADGEGTGTTNSVNNVPAIEGNVSLQIGDIPGLQEALAAAGLTKTVAGVAPGADGNIPLTATDVGADPAGTAAAEVAELGEGLAPVAFTGSFDDMTGDVVAGKIRLTGGLAEFDGPAGSYRNFRFMTGGVIRFDFGVDDSPESGGNAGSDFYLNAFDDAGNYIGTMLSISRRYGLYAPQINTQTAAARSNNTGVATTEYVDRSTGSLLDLTTANKDSLVAAINEVNSKAPGLATELKVSKLAVANSSGGNSIVDFGLTFPNAGQLAILNFHSGGQPTTYDFRIVASGGNGANAGGDLELYGNQLNLSRVTTVLLKMPGQSSSSNAVNTDYTGALTALTTTAKTSLVDAINEVNAKPSGGSVTPLADNFTSNSVTAVGAYFGITTATDSPAPGIGRFYSVTVEKMGTSGGLSYYTQTAKDNQKGLATRVFAITDSTGAVATWGEWSVVIGNRVQGSNSNFNTTSPGKFVMDASGTGNPGHPGATGYLLEVENLKPTGQANATVVHTATALSNGATPVAPAVYRRMSGSAGGSFSTWALVAGATELLTANRDILTSDRDKVLRVTSTSVSTSGMSLPSTSGLPVGWAVTVMNTLVAAPLAVNIAAGDSGTVDGYSGIRVYAGESTTFVHAGSGVWRTLGRRSVVTTLRSSGSSNVLDISISDVQMIEHRVILEGNVPNAGTTMTLSALSSTSSPLPSTDHYYAGNTSSTSVSAFSGNGFWPLRQSSFTANTKFVLTLDIQTVLKGNAGITVQWELGDTVGTTSFKTSGQGRVVPTTQSLGDALRLSLSSAVTFSSITIIGTRRTP